MCLITRFLLRVYNFLFLFLVRQIYTSSDVHFDDLPSKIDTAGNTSFEYLPNELLLLIFSYLNSYEILFAFTNLNQRFQQIIQLYPYNIDLTEQNKPTYGQFQFFCQHILPLAGQNVRSLKLNGNEHLHLFQPHIRWLTNLKSLTIEVERRFNLDDFSDEKKILVKTLSKTSLCELSVFQARQALLKAIVSCKTHNLTTLKCIFVDDIPTFGVISKLTSVRRLYTNIGSLKEVIHIFSKMPNLEELNLSIKYYSRFTSFHKIKVPPTLEKLHLEFGATGDSRYRLNFDHMEQFLNIFKHQLRSLSLIFFNAFEDLSKYDSFNSLVKSFNCLEKFEYYNHSQYELKSSSLFPNITQSRDLSDPPERFGTIPTRTKVHYNFSDLNYRGLRFNYPVSIWGLTTNLQLVNMQKIQLTLADYFQINGNGFLLKTIAQTFDLTHFYTATSDTEKLIKQMFETVSVKQKKQIIHFDLLLCCRVCSWTFLSTLSTILPNLKTFRIYLTNVFDDGLISLTELVRDLRSYFQKLSCLMILVRTERVRNVCERYKKKLDDELKQLTAENTLYYTTQVNTAFFSKDDWVFFNIWL